MNHLESVARLAAANNAEWCDVVCRSHAIEGTLDGDAWTSRARTPPFYPDAVTLAPDVSVPDLLARIDASVGCSIKDSFASLDLTSSGFSVLFDAEWTVRRAAPAPQSAAGPHWDVVRDRRPSPSGSAHGEATTVRATSSGSTSSTTTPCSCSPRRNGDHVVTGAALNRSPDVVGVSNFFSNNGQVAADWANCLAYIDALLPGAVLVGYEPLDALDATRLDDFETAGPLRVWRREG